MDWTTIVVAGIGFGSTITGAVYGIKKANNVIELKLDRLQQDFSKLTVKVEEHNNLMVRLALCENQIRALEKKSGG